MKLKFSCGHIIPASPKFTLIKVHVTWAYPYLFSLEYYEFVDVDRTIIDFPMIKSFSNYHKWAQSQHRLNQKDSAYRVAHWLNLLERRANNTNVTGFRPVWAIYLFFYSFGFFPF